MKTIFIAAGIMAATIQVLKELGAGANRPASASSDGLTPWSAKLNHHRAGRVQDEHPTAEP